MPRFKVAHVKQQGIDLIIVPLDSNFDHQTNEQQQAAIADLQVHAIAAGLAGTVIPVWESGKQMKFIAPPNWHPFFRTVTLQWVFANLNREIYW
jgi:hypothetical protein